MVRGGESLAAVEASPEWAPEVSLIPGFLHLYPYTFYPVKSAPAFQEHRALEEAFCDACLNVSEVFDYDFELTKKATECRVSHRAAFQGASRCPVTWSVHAVARTF